MNIEYIGNYSGNNVSVWEERIVEYENKIKYRGKTYKAKTTIEPSYDFKDGKKIIDIYVDSIKDKEELERDFIDTDIIINRDIYKNKRLKNQKIVRIEQKIEEISEIKRREREHISNLHYKFQEEYTKKCILQEKVNKLTRENVKLKERIQMLNNKIEKLSMEVR